MANNQLVVQNLLAAAKRPVTFVTSLGQGYLTAVLLLQSESDVLRFIQATSNALTVFWKTKIKEVGKNVGETVT